MLCAYGVGDGQWLARESKAPLVTLPSTNILVGFGGLTKEEISKLPHIENVYWIITSPITIAVREDIKCMYSVPFPSLMNAVDIVFSKAGYGILAESNVTGTPQIWMKRSSFPEAKILESFARSKGDIVISSQWGTKRWKQDLKEAVSSLQDTQRSPQNNDNDRLAQWIVNTYGTSYTNKNRNTRQQ